MGTVNTARGEVWFNRYLVALGAMYVVLLGPVGVLPWLASLDLGGSIYPRGVLRPAGEP